MNLRKQWKYLVSVFLALGLLVSVSVFTFFPESILCFMTDLQMKDLGMKSKIIEINGHKISYVEGGSSKQTLLLVHGFRSSKAYWISYFPEFLSDYHVIAVDLPGHGSSEAGKDQHYDLKSMGLFLNEFVQALDLKDIHLVGTSMGGGISLAYASAHSDNIRSLVLVNPLAVQPPRLSEVHEALGRGENLLLPHDMESFYVMQDVVYGSRLDLNPFLEKLILNSLIQNRSFYVKAFNEMVEKGALEDCLSLVSAPVLIIQSDQDRVVDPSCIPIVLDYIPTAEVIWVQNGSHTLKGEQRVYAQKCISQFLLEHDACPSSAAAVK
jgi:abhydrolase domain-containing protein 6